MHRSAAARYRALLGGLLLLGLAGCVRPGAGGPASGGLGADGGEGCRNQLSAFQSAGDPVLREGTRPTAASQQAASPPWARWRRPGQPPAVATATGALDQELAQENAAIDSLQIAFDALLYCRWIEARQIRADLGAGRLARPAAEARMAALRTRLRRDLDRARQVIARLEARDQARAAQIDAAAPGARAAAEEARARRGQGTRAIAAASVLLRLRPEPGAPEVGRLAQGTAATLRPASGGFSAVEAGGQRGYAPTGAFQVASRTVAAPGPTERTGAGATGVRQLVASNIARRDSFNESVTLAESASVDGFQLGT